MQRSSERLSFFPDRQVIQPLLTVTSCSSILRPGQQVCPRWCSTTSPILSVIYLQPNIGRMYRKTACTLQSQIPDGPRPFGGRYTGNGSPDVPFSSMTMKGSNPGNFWMY